MQTGEALLKVLKEIVISIITLMHFLGKSMGMLMLIHHIKTQFTETIFFILNI